MQSWDTANKPSELSDYSVGAAWGVQGLCFTLLNVLRKKLSYPELRRESPVLCGGRAVVRVPPAIGFGDRPRQCVVATDRVGAIRETVTLARPYVTKGAETEHVALSALTERATAGRPDGCER